MSEKKRGLTGSAQHLRAGLGCRLSGFCFPEGLCNSKRQDILEKAEASGRRSGGGCQPYLPPPHTHPQIRDNAKQSQKEKIKEPVSRSREIATERSKIKSKDGLEVKGGIPSSEDEI